MNFAQSPRFRGIAAASVLALVVVAATCAEEPPKGPAAPLAPDWVAQCGGQVLTLGRLAPVVVSRTKQDLLDGASGPSTILKQTVEERVVGQEARRLGIEVTEAEVDAQMKQLDVEVRRKSNGAQTLVQFVTNDMHQTIEEFRANLRVQVRKEKIAGHEKYLGRTLPTEPKARLYQTDIVIGELNKKAKVACSIQTAPYGSATPTLAAGVFATVNEEAITVEDFGRELVRRLPSDVVRSVIVQECKAVLTAGFALTEPQMNVEIQRERDAWATQREMVHEQAWRTVSYDDRVKALYKITLDDMKKDRFFRGIFGLFKHFREQVKDEDVLAEWTKTKDSVWGPSIRVNDIQIGFLQKTALAAPRGSRELAEARRMAREILVQREGGVPFEQIIRMVNQRQDPTFRAGTYRIRNIDDNRILYDHATQMKDGDVTLVEELAAVHVLRRESAVPAPRYEDVKHLVLEGIGTRKAQDWLDAQMENKDVVKVRWPLPPDLMIR